MLNVRGEGRLLRREWRNLRPRRRRAERASERASARYQSPLLKAALEWALKRERARRSRECAPLSAPTDAIYERAFEPYRMCVPIAAQHARLAPPSNVFDRRAPDSARTPGTFRTERKHRPGPPGRPVFGDRCPGGKIDTRPRTDQVNVAATKSRCAHYHAPR